MVTNGVLRELMLTKTVGIINIYKHKSFEQNVK